MFGKAYNGERVLVTGHTGFKGSWLCEWLLALGADVTGYAMDPPTQPSLFEQLGLSGRMEDLRGDVRDIERLKMVVARVRPQFVFHLAAQALVRDSYEAPVETFDTNVMGTINLLEAIRVTDLSCAVVVVTSDKCYENREWEHSYRENDPMGGHDPYSASKGCAELAVAAYQRSFFSRDGSVPVATARAGNVIGGGDWAKDRIIPDCIRSLHKGEAIAVRNPHATRPWQHVLEPLSGYLLLGEKLSSTLSSPQPSRFATAFNFGPDIESNRSVKELVEEVCKHWSSDWEDKSDPGAVHEAHLLNLATDKAFHHLNWRPVWGFEIAAKETVVWYKQTLDGSPDVSDEISAYHLTLKQIKEYCSASNRRNFCSTNKQRTNTRTGATKAA